MSPYRRLLEAPDERLAGSDGRAPNYRQAPGHFEVLGLDLVGHWQHFVVREFDGGLGDLPVLFGEILDRENVLRLALFREKASALYAFRSCM